ncbi:tail fiber protein [Pseudomonas uvaldensis]|uniref:tail fiber protein n=1 Tax=Pseudomonas uvaldensis TaxID=2878385 RepID=UPI001E3088DF|nr:tail fiber protein [Pseudomonas uvaldensis]MCE0461561.1 tail fiber protein [Pseudomonas uvaldensis]
MDYPKSVPSVGLVNGKFVDENPVTGTPGSLIPAVWGNSVTQELLGVITGAGMVPDEADLGQLLLAVRKINQSGLVDYAVDTGTTVNAYIATYKPAPLSLVDGLVLRFKAARANTGASTFAPNGLAARPILGMDHNALQSGEITNGGDVWVQWNSSVGGGAWVMIASTGAIKETGSDVGDIKAVATLEPPNGWLKCNGSLVSRTQYAALFAAIGTRFGPGDGSTTFALPDLRGEFIRGWDDGRGIDAGRALGTAQVGQNASHTHTATAANAGGHVHTLSATAASAGGHEHSLSATAAASGAHTHALSATAASAGAHTHSYDVVGGWADGTPTILAGRSSGSTGNATLSSDSSGAHTHAVSGTATSAGAHGHTVTGSAVSAGEHTHAITGSTIAAGDHTHTITVAPSGGNESRPRNVALLYVIKY